MTQTPQARLMAAADTILIRPGTVIGPDQIEEIRRRVEAELPPGTHVQVQPHDETETLTLIATGPGGVADLTLAFSNARGQWAIVDTDGDGA